MHKTQILWLAIQFSCSGLLAADWPRWRGPDGTGHVPADAVVPQTLPAEPKVIWQINVGSSLGSPVVSGGNVFHLDNQQNQETLHALEAATGRELWSVACAVVHKDNQSAPGPRSSPLVDGDRVYVQSCRGELQCLGAADGRKIWNANFIRDFNAVYIGEKGQAIGASRHGYTGSPVIDGDRIIVNAGGTNGASVVCFEKHDGRVLWKSQNDQAAYVGPVIAQLGGLKQAVVFTVESVLGLDITNGALLWRVPVKTRLGRHVTTPVIVDNLVIVSSHEAGLMALRITRNGIAWKAEPAWLSQELAINMSSPVVVGHYLYGLAKGKKLICVDVRTGEEKWVSTQALTGTLVNDHAAFLVMHNQLLVLTYDGQLLLIAADPQACRVISSLTICGKTWCNPAYADGRLYLRDAQTLRCVQLIP